MKYELTNEQNEIVNTVQTNIGSIVMVDAKAGSGKTSTAKILVNTIKPKKALYTAFNKAIVEEGKGAFSTNVECRTLHSLALQYVRPYLPLPIEPFTYLCIKEKLSYPDKAKIIKAIGAFCRSDSLDLYGYYEVYFTEESEKIKQLTISYTEKLFEGALNPTFDVILKYFHLLLFEENKSLKG